MSARVDLKTYIFSAINVSAVRAITGETTSGNRRVYYGWPQEQPVLSDVEPSEGWIDFYELSSLKVFGGSNVEDHTIQFNLWHKLQSQNDYIVDILDALFDNPPVDQYGYIISTNLNSVTLVPESYWVVLLSQRIFLSEQYEQEIKLYRKICNYMFRTTKIPMRVGP